MNDRLMTIAELGPELGINPSAFFQGACRGEIQLTRIGKRWATTRAAAEAFADRRRAQKALSPTELLAGSGRAE